MRTTLKKAFCNLYFVIGRFWKWYNYKRVVTSAYPPSNKGLVWFVVFMIALITLKMLQETGKIGVYYF